ncbi:MAG: hypothetical protein WAK50_11320 [Nitrososphaeraceae archaeon]|jgi:hypothetical protein
MQTTERTATAMVKTERTATITDCPSYREAIVGVKILNPDQLNVLSSDMYEKL